MLLHSDCEVTKYLEPPRQLPGKLMAGPEWPSFLTPLYQTGPALLRSGNHHQFPTLSSSLPGYLKTPGQAVPLRECSSVRSSDSTKLGAVPLQKKLVYAE